MSTDLVPESPFDGGRIPCPQGGEDRWSARWLMERMGYLRWEDFERVIERAKVAAHNQGFNVQILFRVNPKKTGGRPQTDYLVTRFAAYLIAMNGDPRKVEVSAAQEYFVVKTREAETAPQAATLDLADPDVALDKIIELATLAKRERAARIEAESVARELQGPASAWNELADSAGDYSVADAAKVLSRDPNIETGERRLYAFMATIGWVFKVKGRWRAYQSQVEIGRLSEKVGKPFWHEGRGEMVLPEPTVRVTPKGLAELHKRLGGTGQLALVAAS
ncbi:phage antirepressor KilAC domain-containing protein [Mycobacterium avium]|uniref:phage antirepressor KilAC domain-containing protein n=1 Tax=Mycobacterium avium TaxID=1764 RepID=UPI0020D068CE|nr:phage antirepressor KilAC domain-containing protein [Mycobacterium avium]